MRVSSKQYLEATSQLSGNGEASQNELFAKIGSRKCFRDADENKDGIVTQDEVTLSAEAFARLDASRDGKVTQEEMDAAMSGHGQDVFSFYTSRHRAANSQDLLAGVLGASTTEEGGDAAEKAAREYMTRRDANTDGVLSSQEASVSAAAFGNIDTSGNGSLELEEIQAVLKTHDARLSSYYSSLRDGSSQSTLQKKV
jgi:Ca2+-binding EF-hand superfamily protein